VHHDQDTVYTSYDWLQRLLIRDRARVSYAEHGARDNPWIESLWGHFKVENGSLLCEAASLEELEWVVERQMRYYNERRRHSGVGHMPPVEYLRRKGIHPRVLVETGPQSGSVSGAQVPTTMSSISVEVRVGEQWGRRDRSPSPCAPSSRYSSTHFRTTFRDVCHRRAVSAMLPVSRYVSTSLILAASPLHAYASLPGKIHCPLLLLSLSPSSPKEHRLLSTTPSPTPSAW